MSLIGNRTRFALEAAPVSPSWERRYCPERGAWAGLALWVAGENICSHVPPGGSQVVDMFFIPLGPLADWLVRVFPALEFEERAAAFPTSRLMHRDVERWADTPPPGGFDEDDWLDAREAWWSRHFMRAGSDGARIPDIALVRDDEELVIEWRRPPFSGQDRPTLLVPEGEFSVAWHEGFSVLEEFTAQVAEWLRADGAGDVYPWASRVKPMRSIPPLVDQAIEYLAGRDMTTLATLLGARDRRDLFEALGLPQDTEDPGASAECQVLRDLSPEISSEVGNALRTLGAESRRYDADAIAHWTQARSTALDAARPGTTPEEAGQSAAAALRDVMNLNGAPLPEMREVLPTLGLWHEHLNVPGRHDRMMVTMRADGSVRAVTLNTPRTNERWGQRFEVARALGHVLLDPLRHGAIGAGDGPYAQRTRRRRSGAFAAEFLLPEVALAEVSGGRLDGAAERTVFQRLLEQYGIGARAAAFQLWNRGWLSSPLVRDELIDEFAAQT